MHGAGGDYGGFVDRLVINLIPCAVNTLGAAVLQAVATVLHRFSHCHRSRPGICPGLFALLLAVLFAGLFLELFPGGFCWRLFAWLAVPATDFLQNFSTKKAPEEVAHVWRLPPALSSIVLAAFCRRSRPCRAGQNPATAGGQIPGGGYLPRAVQVLYPGIFMPPIVPQTIHFAQNTSRIFVQKNFPSPPYGGTWGTVLRGIDGGKIRRSWSLHGLSPLSRSIRSRHACKI